eukprot:scaffold73098_cov43-Cyclotella_meneghiniana.AAC.3
MLCYHAAFTSFDRRECFALPLRLRFNFSAVASLKANQIQICFHVGISTISGGKVEHVGRDNCGRNKPTGTGVSAIIHMHHMIDW